MASNGHSTDIVQIEDIFQKADLLLFKEKNFDQAEKLFRQVLQLDPKNIDAFNSIAYCIKFRTLGYENASNGIYNLSPE